MREVIGEILKKKINFSSYCLFFDILDIAKAISRKVLVLEAKNFQQLIEYNE